MVRYHSGFEIGVNARPFGGEVELFVMQWKDGTQQMVLQPFGTDRTTVGGGYLHDFQLLDHTPGAPLRPTLTLADDAARHLMDGLWRAGIRPSEGVENAGQLKATERHLADMRAIVADKLKVEWK